MFPVTSAAEMAGQGKENNVSKAATKGDLPKVWDGLAKRLRRIEEYVELFKLAFPGEIQKKSDIEYSHAANAIAAFEIAAWRANQSPYDAYLAGDTTALTANEEAGRQLFFGAAGCSSCHSGEVLSDMDFHAIWTP